MGEPSPAVDAYIERAAPFAQPILRKLRTLFLEASPLLEEHIKWGSPSFDYKGIVVGMVAFKEHVGFGFWKSAIMEDPAGLFRDQPRSSPMFIKLSHVDEVPPAEVLISYVRAAVELNEKGIKVPSQKKSASGSVVSPADLDEALNASMSARIAFDALSPSHKREYIEWINEAKREETRARRIATTVEWLIEGKSRNWKYERKS
jgi:uncharacterized protein YdeI (YjbR/CyaY-like superfamily)